MHEVPIPARSTAAFDGLLGQSDRRRLDHALRRLRITLDGRRLWHVNSAASGGGVAEMLTTLLPYAVGGGVPVTWMVVEGDDGFFTVTKRVHNRLHDQAGDGGPLGAAERARYDGALRPQRDQLLRAVRPGDVAVLHDPQTAGLVVPLRDAGLHVVWRCHVGTDDPGACAREAWAFLWDDVAAADAAVFSRAQYAWDGLWPGRVATMAPCIDVRSPKNQPLSDAATEAILDACGIVPSPRASAGPPAYVDGNGTRRVVRRRAEVIEEAPAPPDARLVSQVSRWDRLKDPVGLLRAFARHGPRDADAHLLLVGPMDGVADDPESAGTFAEVRDQWSALGEDARRRVHLARVPMDEPHENAAVVNAVQRRTDLVVQKSVAEGFGLTVAEAMWKARPVVASRVGGIQDQVVNGESGLLVDDPRDLPAFGRALRTVLEDGQLASRLGAAARVRVADHFLPLQHFVAEALLVDRVLAGAQNSARRRRRRGRPSGSTARR